MNNSNQKKLLIVWVYYPAVGHLVEAIEVAANYFAANPNIEIHLLLNDKTPYVIGEYCDFIHKTHSIAVNSTELDSEKIQELTTISFDYVVFPKRLKYTPQDFPKELLEVNQHLQQKIQPKIWGGYNDTPSPNNQTLTETPNAAFKIKIPQDILTFHPPGSLGSPVFSVMLKGASKASIWPTLKMWKSILISIKEKYPNASFMITGVLSAHLTAKHNEAEMKNKISHFISSIPDAVNCYNIGLENQLNIIQNSDVFISPHTGFAFLAPCLGTPWLALSGGEWAEAMPARMPFYNVLPKCNCYPCNNGDKKIECQLRIKLKQPIKCMASLDNKKSDLLLGLEKLLNRDYTFEESFKDYEDSAIKNKVNTNKLWRIKSYNKLPLNKK